MSDIRLGRPEYATAGSGAQILEGGCERCELRTVADPRPAALRLDAANSGDVGAAVPVEVDNHLSHRSCDRSHKGRSTTVMTHRAGTHDGMDVVTVLNRTDERLQHQYPRSVTEHHPVGLLAEGTTLPTGR